MINNPKLIRKIIDQIKGLSKEDLDEAIRLVEMEEDASMELREERMLGRLIEAFENLVEDKNKGKVIFEFKDGSHDINLITNRYKMINAIEQLANYKRELEKYDVPGEIIVKDGKVLTDEELRDYNPESYEGRKTYIEVEEVINKLNNMLDEVYWLIYGD